MLTTRILLADDHHIVRQGARALLETHSGWEVCGEASTGREAVALAEQLSPDVVITDLTMPELNGVEVIRQIKRLLPETEILVFTGAETDQAVHDAFQNGARGFLLKTEMGAKLISAVERICEHKPVYSSRIADIIFHQYMKGGSAADSETATTLTARERETVQMLAEGRTNKEIASALGISAKTVETHRATIMRKLGFRSFSDLVRYAIRNNLVQP